MWPFRQYLTGPAEAVVESRIALPNIVKKSMKEPYEHNSRWFDSGPPLENIKEVVGCAPGCHVT